MEFDGFDWDDGNWPKCASHGLSKSEIEGIFANELITNADPSVMERRYRAVGRGSSGRLVFVVYTFRLREERKLIRPISARFMHKKEIRRYEQDET